jgi:hypothetical protein
MTEPATRSGITAAELLEEELYGVLVQAAGEDHPLGLPWAYGKLRAAEDYYADRLQLQIGVQRIVSDAKGRNLDPDTYDIDEPAYDWTADMFAGDRWGEFYLNHRPVVDVSRFVVSYPGMSLAQSVIPRSWVQLNREEAKVELVPGRGGDDGLIAYQLRPILTGLHGGSRLPNSIFVDYTAGITPQELRRRHNHLLQAIKARALLIGFSALTNARTGGLGSQSLSVDGLSRNENYHGGKYGPYSGAIEQLLQTEKDLVDAWRAAHREPLMIG